MALQNPQVALLVHSCDRYEFLYKGFQLFFNKYWNFGIGCTCYFITEEKAISVPGFKTVLSGKGEWSDRLSFVLRNEIPEQYVIYFQEDMWLIKTVNSAFFQKLFDLVILHNWQQVKLHSSFIYNTIETDLFIEGFNIARVDNKSSDFLMSHQVTLWNKDFLLNQLWKNEHPWRNERKSTERLKKLDPEIFHIDYFAENGNKEINKNNHPILRSEYLTISNNGMLNPNIEYCIDELKAGDLEQQEYAAKLEYNYLNHLTHDGKPRPRKTDIFKRTKNWLSGK